MTDCPGGSGATSRAAAPILAPLPPWPRYSWRITSWSRPEEAAAVAAAAAGAAVARLQRLLLLLPEPPWRLLLQLQLALAID